MGTPGWGDALCTPSNRHGGVVRQPTKGGALSCSAPPRAAGRAWLCPITVPKGGRANEIFLQSQRATRLMCLSANHRQEAKGLSGRAQSQHGALGGMRVKLLLPAAPVLLPHHDVGALISGRDKELPCPRQVATPPPLPDILGCQVKRDKPTGSAAPLTGRTWGPPGDGVPGSREACWEL